MHKSNKYVFAIMLLVGLFLFVAHYLRYQHNIIFEQDGYQMIQVDESQTISPHKEPIVFIIESNEKEKEVYKFNGYENGDFGIYNYYYFKEKDAVKDNDYYFVKAFKNDLPFENKLANLSFEERYDIVHKGNSFNARQLIQHNMEAGIFGYIDTMPLIFIVLGLVAFLLLKLVDFFRFLLSKITKYQHRDFILHLILILLLILFLSIVRMIPWHPSSQAAILVRNAITILPIFFLFNWVKQTFSSSNDFWKTQFLFLMVILVVGNILLWLGNSIGFMIDNRSIEKIIHLPYFCSYNSLAVGFLMAFSIGILLNNLANNIFKNMNKEKISST